MSFLSLVPPREADGPVLAGASQEVCLKKEHLEQREAILLTLGSFVKSRMWRKALVGRFLLQSGQQYKAVFLSSSDKELF